MKSTVFRRQVFMDISRTVQMFGEKSMKRQTKITKIFYLYTHAEKHVLLSGNIFKRVNDIINKLCF
jgi:hypothetical protein